jgi:hypothetical protein
MASDALCRGSSRTGSGLSAGPVRWCRQARLHDHLVKGDRFVETRTPSLDECSLPRPLTPSGARERDRREPATVPAVLPPRAGFRRPFTLRARGRGLDPDAVSDWTRRLSSTSAIRTAREHNRVDPPDPRTGSRRRSSPSSRWTGRRPPGRGSSPFRHDDRRVQAVLMASSLQRSLRIVEEDLHLAPAEGSRVRGRPNVSPGASRHGRRHHEDGTRLDPRERGIR